MKQNRQILIIGAFIISLLFSWQSFAMEGGDIGNGGVGYKNKKDQKIYFLDYIVMKDVSYYDYVTYKGSKKSDLNQLYFSEFISKLKETFPLLYIEFQLFLRSYQEGHLEYHFQDKGIKEITWDPGIPSKSNDQNLKVELPPEYNSAQQIQLVLRNSESLIVQVPHKGEVRFVRDFFIRYVNNIQRLKRNGIQFTWLMIHEWLWQYGLNIEQIRRLNAYFHSQQFLKQEDPTKAYVKLQKDGFLRRYIITTDKILSLGIPALNQVIFELKELNYDFTQPHLYKDGICKEGYVSFNEDLKHLKNTVFFRYQHSILQIYSAMQSALSLLFHYGVNSKDFYVKDYQMIFEGRRFIQKLQRTRCISN